MNHLEQLVAEWLSYQEYFVLRNIKVGRRSKSGYECELDVVAFHPGLNKLVQFEPSTDSHSWAKREERYAKKFEAGRRYIPGLFAGMKLPAKLDQYALFLLGSRANHSTIAGGEVVMVEDLLKEITTRFNATSFSTGIVPEQYPLLRTLQLTCEYRATLWKERK